MFCVLDGAEALVYNDKAFLIQEKRPVRREGAHGFLFVLVRAPCQFNRYGKLRILLELLRIFFAAFLKNGKRA